jgi:hypothetical protein
MIAVLLDAVSCAAAASRQSSGWCSECCSRGSLRLARSGPSVMRTEGDPLGQLDVIYTDIVVFILTFTSMHQVAKLQELEYSIMAQALMRATYSTADFLGKISLQRSPISWLCISQSTYYLQ